MKETSHDTLTPFDHLPEHPAWAPIELKERKIPSVFNNIEKGPIRSLAPYLTKTCKQAYRMINILTAR